MYLLHVSFVLVLVSVRKAETQNTERCASSDEAARNFTCMFDDDACGWSNNPNNAFNWSRVSGCCAMAAVATDKKQNQTARLETSLICGRPDDRYSLHFGYQLEANDNDTCQLSVYTASGSNYSLVWLSKFRSPTYPRTTNISKSISGYNESFKVLFQTQKLTDQHKWCRTTIYHVAIEHETLSTSSISSMSWTPGTTEILTISATSTTFQTSTASKSSNTPRTLTTPTASATSTKSVTSTKVTSVPSKPGASSQLTTSQSSTPLTSTSVAGHSDRTGENNGPLSTGAIIGIIVGLVVVCVVVCVAVILLLRRKTAGKKVPRIFKKLRETQRGNSPPSGGRSVANSADIDADDVIAVNTYPAKPKAALSAEDQANSDHVNTSTSRNDHKVPRKTPGNSSSLPQSSDYEVTDVSESSHHYSVLLDEDGTSTLQPGGKTKGGNPNYKLAIVVDSDVGYSSVGDVDLKESKTATAKTEAYAKVKKVKGDNYNKLPFQNPGFVTLDNTTDDTYNHLQDQDNIYKVPRSDAKEAPMAGQTDEKAVGSSHSEDGKFGYVTVSMKGKGKAPLARDGDYNHLSLKDGHPAISAASNGHRQSQDVYNHLNDQSDEYNRVDFDGRTLHITGDESGTYNHLADFQE